MIKIIKYVQYLLLTACIAQNLALGPDRTSGNDINPAEAALVIEKSSSYEGVDAGQIPDAPSPHEEPRSTQKVLTRSACKKKACKKKACETNHANAFEHNDPAASSTADEPNDPAIGCSPCAPASIGPEIQHGFNAHHEEHTDPAVSSTADEPNDPAVLIIKNQDSSHPHNTQPESKNSTEPRTHRRSKSTV